ncbi:hypothetical protein DKG77_01770 [Flagellimonas aquimarina]|uniref:DUF6265 domain-containing protein n=1 Tax=Flagellimonas aquimarina TaxID=2201895 RepID=A0A316KZ97_9FLAO|nr:DUF6265 family protein [Allomuricauda koreensis]PWL39587.1 hypothetical protein DKG77_01770 [Allomuricauda koreensis]
MKTILFLLLFNITLLQAQKTFQLNEGQKSPKGDLEQVSWITGHWRGEAFGGISEEIWSPPLGDSMMFVFRLINEGKVSFYEIGHIRQLDTTLIMQLKHFHGNLKGWESKDKTIDFKLIKLEKHKAYFEGITFERVNENEINVYVLVEDSGNSEEVLFNYKRF